MNNENGKGIIIIVSGPSASGKGTVVSRALEKADDARIDVQLSVSMTTRGIGKGEVDGETYYYVSKEDFEKMKDYKIIVRAMAVNELNCLMSIVERYKGQVINKSTKKSPKDIIVLPGYINISKKDKKAIINAFRKVSEKRGELK